ncbi:MAG: AarF/UbiB family protein, partial [Acidobacteriota bacterium]
MVRGELDERVRLLTVYNTIYLHAVDATFSRSGLIRSLRQPLQKWLWKRPVERDRLDPPARFRLLLEALGPTYVKVGQLISSQAQTLPSDWIEELSRLQSDAPPFPVDEVERAIESDLGAPPRELYQGFDPAPLAAASLAQVHRATLDDGRPVAVKVQRPNIQRQLQADVRILARTARALERRTHWARDLDLAGVVNEFGATLLEELDYRIEAYNAQRLATVLAPIDGVGVAGVIHDLSGARVLTLEYIDGVEPGDNAALDEAGVDRELVARRMVGAAVKMLVVDGFFHADPHPGNVLVDRETGGLTLIDTGMVGQFSLQQRFSIAGLIYATYRRDVNGLAKTMRLLSTPSREVDDRAFDRDFERRITPLVDPPPGAPPQSPTSILPVALDLLLSHGYRLDSELTLGLKSLVQAQAITEALVPEGVAVVVRAQHSCMGCRGAMQPDAVMVTSAMRGAFREDAAARAEFFTL